MTNEILNGAIAQALKPTEAEEKMRDLLSPAYEFFNKIVERMLNAGTEEATLYVPMGFNPDKPGKKLPMVAINLKLEAVRMPELPKEDDTTQPTEEEAKNETANDT